MKLNEGDAVLVTGYAFFEKALIEKAEKGQYILSNGFKIDKNFNVISSNKFIVKPFIEEEYQFLVAKSAIPKLLDEFSKKYTSLSKEKTIKIYKKLNILSKKHL